MEFFNEIIDHYPQNQKEEVFAYSGARRPPNPEHVGHPFRAKAATFYGKLESVADINRNLK